MTPTELRVISLRANLRAAVERFHATDHLSDYRPAIGWGVTTPTPTEIEERRGLWRDVVRAAESLRLATGELHPADFRESACSIGGEV